MKTFSVSLLVVSSSLGLVELTSKLGRQHSSGSHSMGDTSDGSKLWSETIWRLDSDAPETAALSEHLVRLEAQFPAKELRQLVPADCTLRIDIAVFFDSANVSAAIARTGLKIIESYDADLVEITCYPSTF